MDAAKTIHVVWATSYIQLYIAAGIVADAIILMVFYMMRRKERRGKLLQTFQALQG